MTDRVQQCELLTVANNERYVSLFSSCTENLKGGMDCVAT
jgi:hypothetical protein